MDEIKARKSRLVIPALIILPMLLGAFYVVKPKLDAMAPRCDKAAAHEWQLAGNGNETVRAMHRENAFRFEALDAQKATCLWWSP